MMELQFLHFLLSAFRYPLVFLELYPELLYRGLPLCSPVFFSLFDGRLALLFVLFRLVTRSRNLGRG
jgi:hypothetical protein